MAGTLTAVLRSPRTTPAEAAEAFRHLLLLQAEGAPCLEHSDPIQLYLNTQARTSAACTLRCRLHVTAPPCCRCAHVQPLTAALARLFRQLPPQGL